MPGNVVDEPALGVFVSMAMKSSLPVLPVTRKTSTRLVPLVRLWLAWPTFIANYVLAYHPFSQRTGGAIWLNNCRKFLYWRRLYGRSGLGLPGRNWDLAL